MGERYDILFSFKIDHEFFNNSYLPIDIVPSAETISILKGYKANISLHNNLLHVVIPAIDGKPINAIPQGTTFRFYFRTKDSRFNNVTGGVQSLPQKVLYFTNFQSQNFGGITFISAPIAKYNKNQAYEHGDLASNASGAIYESLLTNMSGASSKGLTNTTYWKKLDTALTYVSPADQIDKVNNVLAAGFDPLITSLDVSVKQFNPLSSAFDQDALTSFSKTFSGPTGEVSIGIDSLPNARYKATFNGVEGNTFYKDEQLFKNNFDGVIEISNHELLPEAGKLVDSNGLLKRPVFGILFRSRSLLWRYVTKTPDDVTSLVDINDNSLAFTLETDKSFLSNKLMELQENSTRTIVLKKGSIVKSFVLQTPQNQTFKKIVKDNNTFLVTEVFINF
jgi:hypothetical protein